MLSFKELIVDKENEDVKYSDESHVYWTKDGEQQCISVTTLIGKYHSFDTDFWSSYKALESILGNKKFLEIKPNLLKRKVFKKEMLETLSIEEDVFEKEKESILSKWDEKREKSCIRGTKLHKDYELKTLGKEFGWTKDYDIPVLFSSFKLDTSNKIVPGQYVLPELLVSRISDDGMLRIAGQADLVIVDGEEFIIMDYKSNEEIKTKSYYDRSKRKSERMHYPLNNIQDSNYWHYTLQLSLYAWIIEKNNPHMKCKGLYLLHHDHQDKKTTYKLDYLKNDVVRMLVHYRKQMDYEQWKKDNAPWK